jgi:molybdopterin-containing oxidoreductase family iron-sulfur binding subunit
VDPAPIVAALAVALVPVELEAADHLEIDLAPSPVIGDGRFASNAWLQELPRPVTKETWGNAAHVAPVTAAALGVHDGDELAITRDGRTIAVPVVIVPEHVADVVSLDLGYGRRTPSQPLCDGLGGDGYALRGSLGESIVVAQVRATGRSHALARTQEDFDMHDRAHAPTFDVATWRRDPDLTSDARGPLPTLLDEQNHDGLQWAMTIDTTICSGCSACVIACQAENNIPVVGAEHVRQSREMHWLRIDSYRTDAGLVNQPMACQHCEHAPCEYVCPVFATVHSPDGLNEMVYNRCVGTRFCSNNCPYKVRRFNWFAFDEPVTTAALQHNPDVTVRSRGVMEKCTYCVQRIRGAEIQARVAGRAIEPGEVVTACQQACPMGAIQFGALAHAETPMVRWRNESRAYEVLHDLGTRPRTHYLARVRNPPEDT